MGFMLNVTAIAMREGAIGSLDAINLFTHIMATIAKVATKSGSKEMQHCVGTLPGLLPA